MSRFEQQVKTGDQLMPDKAATAISVEMFRKTNTKANDLDLAKLNNELHRGGLLPGLNIVGQDSSGHLLIADNKQGSAHKLYQVDQHGKLTASYGVENQGQSKVFKKQDENKPDSSENKNDPYRFHQGEVNQRSENEPNKERTRRNDAARPQDQPPPTVPSTDGSSSRPQEMNRSETIENPRGERRANQNAERKTKARSIDYYDEVNFHSNKLLA